MVDPQLATLLASSPAELHRRLEAGHPIDAAALDDTEYHGVALGLPAWVERLSWKTFKKVFRRDEDNGVLRGWNVAVEQHGLDAPYVDRLRGGERVLYGPYEVHPAAAYRLPGRYHFGLVIDYGRATGGFDPQGTLRDPLVAVNAGSVELLLGYSFVELGFMRFRTPAYFALRRGEPLTYDWRS